MGLRTAASISEERSARSMFRRKVAQRHGANSLKGGGDSHRERGEPRKKGDNSRVKDNHLPDNANVPERGKKMSSFQTGRSQWALGGLLWYTEEEKHEHFAHYQGKRR